jgi:GrpB-like predicted nucleotidyltransferase (UPF0157 family)
MNRPIQYTNHAYEVVDYLPAWPAWYKDEEKVLKEIFGGSAIRIDHVGSTSVPGMAAKPQLDILIQVEGIESVDGHNDALSQAGYEAYGDMLHKGGRLFSKWRDGTKTVNLHVFETASPIVREYILVRNYLCAHPEEAEAYAALKVDLYKKYPNDYLKYRQFKDPYIAGLLSRIPPEFEG